MFVAEQCVLDCMIDVFNLSNNDDDDDDEDEDENAHRETFTG